MVIAGLALVSGSSERACVACQRTCCVTPPKNDFAQTAVAEAAHHEEIAAVARCAFRAALRRYRACPDRSTSSVAGEAVQREILLDVRGNRASSHRAHDRENDDLFRFFEERQGAHQCTRCRGAAIPGERHMSGNFGGIAPPAARAVRSSASVSTKASARSGASAVGDRPEHHEIRKPRRFRHALREIAFHFARRNR